MFGTVCVVAQAGMAELDLMLNEAYALVPLLVQTL